MVSISAAASFASRRRRLVRSSPPHDSAPSASTSCHRHSHRHRSPDLHSHSRPRPSSTAWAMSASEAEYECGSSAPRVVTEDEYAGAMAAQARLHAKLRANGLVTCNTRASCSAPVLRENVSTCKYPWTSRSEADTVSSACGPSDVHMHPNTTALSKPRTGLHINGREPSKSSMSMPTPHALKEAEECISEPDDCSICLESFASGKILVCWPCKHKFHYKCLNMWLKAHVHCPNCRANVLKVESSRLLSAGFLSTLYGKHFEKNVTSFKDTVRTLPSFS